MSKYYKLFIDDIRPAPDGWVLAESITEAINFLYRHNVKVKEVSFDYDISIPVEIDGRKYNRPSPDNFECVAKFLGILASEYNHHEYKCYAHSSNPDGRKAIVRTLRENGLDCEEIPCPVAKRV